VPGAAQREAISAFTRVFDALWRNGALQTRDRSRPWRSRISGSPLRKGYALHRIRDMTRRN